MEPLKRVIQITLYTAPSTSRRLRYSSGISEANSRRRFITNQVAGRETTKSTFILSTAVSTCQHYVLPTFFHFSLRLISPAHTQDLREGSALCMLKVVGIQHPAADLSLPCLELTL